jgi:tripartite-type tricarboxylate transporter receptor subunit TctC
MFRTTVPTVAVARSALAALAALCAPCAVLAQPAYPSKPVRLIVPYPPGGGNDTISRLLAARISPEFGQPMVVDNRPGAGTTIGTALAARAAPDGHTIVMSSPASHSMAPQLFAAPGYDPVKDFQAITLIGTTPAMMVVSSSLPYRAPKDVVAAAKAAPGKLSFATGGNGTPPHLAAAVFVGMTGIDLIHVPYKGSGPAHIDLISGAVTMMIDTAASASPHVRSGKLRGLAITGRKRHPDFTDVQTFAEQGMPDYDASAWYGIHAPAGIQKPILSRLHAEIVRVVRLPDMDERLRGMLVEPVAGSPEEFDRFVRDDIDKWGKVIRAQKLKVD